MAGNGGFLPTAFWKKAILLVVLIATTFLRLYNLPQTVQFQGDQGRDAMIVADIFREKDLAFIGPVTSVGNLYLGPLYYYFMLPFLWLSYPSPLGPVYAVALLGIAATYLVYFLGKKMIGENGALIATFFYAFSATIIDLTRFSWNPNPAPFVSALMVYATYVAWKKNPRWWVWVAVCFSVLIQLHYLTLLVAPAAGVIWLVSLREHLRSKTLSKILLPTALGAVIFLVSLTPLVLFDWKHGGVNATAFQALLSSPENFATDSHALSKFGVILKETEGRSLHILFEYMIGKNRPLNRALLVGTIVGVAWLLAQKHKQKKDLTAEWVLLAYVATGIVGTAFYQHTVFDHYIAYLFPLTAWVYGYIFSHGKPRWLFSILLGVIAVIFLRFNFPRYPWQPMGWTLHDIQRTSDAITQRVQPGEKYNIVLVSESGDIDGQNYRYFLTTSHTPPVRIEERDSVDTLFIIDEQKLPGKVTDSPVYEIVVFPDKDPAEVFDIEGGPQITVLRRATQAPAEPIE